jgi:hypothetical protein
MTPARLHRLTSTLSPLAAVAFASVSWVLSSTFAWLDILPRPGAKVLPQVPCRRHQPH